jgi:hypothetical protein
MTLATKGTGGYFFFTGTTQQLSISHTASAVNYLQVTGAAASGGPLLITQGSDTNINLLIGTKGTGAILFRSNNGATDQFRVSNTTSAVNYLQVTGGATGAAATLSAQGSDTNIDLALTPKGTGVVKTNGGLSVTKTAVTSPAATDGNVFSGTYTPTLTNVTNISSSTVEGLHYMRVGSVVTVAGRVRVTATAAGNVRIDISLPIATTFTAGNQLGGAGGSATGVVDVPTALMGNPTDHRAIMAYVAPSTDERFLAFTFTYRIM